MQNKISLAYKELQNLVDGYIYSIDQISWWLLKYGDLYKEISSRYNKLCNTCIELSEENLPSDCLRKPDYCNKKPEFRPFITFYDELDKATQLHKLESKCTMAYQEYVFLWCVEENLRNWVIKNYDTFYQLGGYFYGYMEFNSKDDKSLHIAEAPDLSFGVAIREEDFKSSIQFYDVYYDLYYEKKLYPEKIKEWDEFFSKIQMPKDEL
jgi:hypothetical protein